MWKRMVVAAVGVLAISIVSGPNLRSRGQEKVPKGRLPPYYSAIVTDQQRTAIYAIQAKSVQQLAALQSQIELLEKQRDQEIENVLSPQQKLLLNKALADAATKRKKAADDKIAGKLADLQAANAPPPAEAKKGRVKKDKVQEAKEAKDVKEK